MQSKVFQNLAELCVQAVGAYRCLCVACSCVCALVLRRHLMVWDVFAPKLAFEGSIWMVQAVVLVVVWGRIEKENRKKKL